MDSPSAIFPSSYVRLFIRSRFFFFFLLLVILSISTVSYSSPVPTISYSDHCAHIVPEAAPTTPLQTAFPYLDLETSRYSGGERVLGRNKSYPGYAYSHKYLTFFVTEKIFNTDSDDLYKIEASLHFYAQHFYHVPKNSSLDDVRISSLIFLLNGFWSVSLRKLCMIGLAPWYSSDQGKQLNLEAVLKLNIARNTTVYTSLISGVLESLVTSANDPSYFEPISIVSVSRVIPDENYNYSLVSEEGCCSDNILVPPNSSLSLNGKNICSAFKYGPHTYKLLYPRECNSSKICTPFGGTTGNFTSLLSLHIIQCDDSSKKLRYLVRLSNSSDQVQIGVDLSSDLIGEGMWDSENNQLCIVVCRILSLDEPLGSDHPMDCSIRLNLRYQAVWSIKNRISVQGEIWSNKTANEVGYFERIKFQSENDGVVASPDIKYEYTEIERVTKSCHEKNPIEKKGERYPDGRSYSMGFDVSVKHSGRTLAWGFAHHLFIGRHLVDQYSRMFSFLDSRYTGPMNISYLLSFMPTTGIQFSTGISSLNASLGANGQVEIFAEGVYDDRTGHLCMVGCRRLISNDQQESFDCEILLKIQFPDESGTNTTVFIIGSIESTRNKYDSLYFERLDVSSPQMTYGDATF